MKKKDLSRAKVILSTAKSFFCVDFGGGRYVDSPVSPIFVRVSMEYQIRHCQYYKILVPGIILLLSHKFD